MDGRNWRVRDMEMGRGSASIIAVNRSSSPTEFTYEINPNTVLANANILGQGKYFV